MEGGSGTSNPTTQKAKLDETPPETLPAAGGGYLTQVKNGTWVIRKTNEFSGDWDQAVEAGGTALTENSETLNWAEDQDDRTRAGAQLRPRTWMMMAGNADRGEQL